MPALAIIFRVIEWLGSSAGPPPCAAAALPTHAMITIRVTGTSHQLDVENEMPLLWVLRDEIGLTGTKYGCGITACGACTVHVNSQTLSSCTVPSALIRR